MAVASEVTPHNLAHV